jgi:hypothetical protein
MSFEMDVSSLFKDERLITLTLTHPFKNQNSSSGFEYAEDEF